jgi:hypothetical protein
MVLIFKDKADGTNRYIKKYGAMVFLTKDSRGAENELPKNWEVITLPSGHLRLRKKI